MDSKRVILFVLDSFGVGALPDAAKYGDQKANTLLHVNESIGGLKVPNMEKLGLGKIIDVPGINSDLRAIGAFGKSNEKSLGKDTTTGHWEIAQIILDKPFPTYPNGFPKDVTEKFEEAIGREILANKPASGTAIIDEFGKKHMETGKPIIYTSADSVFQIAAHEEVIPLKTLYEYCEIARKLLQGEHAVGRVIARPFIGQPGKFTRTSNRHDYSIVPTSETTLDKIKGAGLPVVGVGKIKDIYANKGLTDSVYTVSNMDGVDKTLEMMDKHKEGFIFTNLVDFDMKYGHRKDPEGYGKALENFDARLPEIISRLNDEDVLILTADHGCDPTTEGTDHSREYIPIMIYGNKIKENVELGVRESFSDIGATILDLLNVKNNIKNGVSFLNLISE
ncbi:phosphopentomutase [Clostridium sediminicola]|uniref:phosphopentomutase n=1 Tax=Clostridium sediminicola TaxID=3114879 RepID=UPI0031F25A32